MAAATAARKPATKTRAQRNASAVQRARTAHTKVAPAPVRRKSGPVRKPMPKRSTVAAPRPAIARVAQGGATLLLDSILRGRAWVALVGVLLAGIVFLNVSVLELNRGIAENAAKTDRLEIKNSKLRGRVAKLDSAERIQQLAEARGFVLPQPGDVTYLEPRPARDAKLAATRITPPTDEVTTDPVAVTAPVEAAPAEPVAPVATEPAPVEQTATTTP